MRFFILYFLVFSLTILSLPVVNYHIDKYGAYQEIENGKTKYYWNKFGQNPIVSVRSAAINIRNSPDTTLLMGSSRMDGFDQEVLANQLQSNVIVLNLPGSTIVEHLHNLKGILEQGARPKSVVIGIDDFDLYYNGPYSTRRIYPNNLLEKVSEHYHLLMERISLPELIDIATKEPHFGEVKYSRLVYPGSNNILDEINTSKEHRDKILNMNGMQFDAANKDFYIEENIGYIQQIVTLAKSYDFDLTFFFTPRWAAASYRLDHEKIFDFKRKLVKVSPFYDYSGIVEMSTMPEYWKDSSHFNSAVAYEVGENLLDKRTDEMFGRYVTEDNIEKHLTELKTNLTSELESFMKTKIDTTVYPPLLSWLYPDSKVERASIKNFIKEPESYLVDKKSLITSLERNFYLEVPPLKNVNRISIGVMGPEREFYSDSKESFRMNVFVNDEFYGEVIYGISGRKGVYKDISIISDFGNTTNIRFEVESLYDSGEGRSVGARL